MADKGTRMNEKRNVLCCYFFELFIMLQYDDDDAVLYS